jgi:hypothetical protein
MAKSRKNRKNIIKNITETANKTLPIVDDGLKTVGNTAKGVAKTSVPVIEKGVSAVYETMVTGLDLGVKGAKSVAKGVSKIRKTRGKKSRSRKSRGGKRCTRK